MAKKNKTEQSYRPTILNRKAKREYQFLDTYEAGIVLNGTEIKSIRLGNVQLGEAYCFFKGDELFIRDMYIKPYEMGNIFNGDPRRERKLLLSRKELDKLKAKMEEQGLTLIASKLYFSERNMAKLQIALAKGKKLYDKRHDIKERDVKRNMDRELKL